MVLSERRQLLPPYSYRAAELTGLHGVRYSGIDGEKNQEKSMFSQLICGHTFQPHAFLNNISSSAEP